MSISKQSVLSILGSPIAYYATFAKVVDDVCAGVFISQFFYWYERGADPEHWVYKSREEITEETGLSRRNQETARRKLVELGILEEQLRGMPARLHYRLDIDRLFELTDSLAGTDRTNKKGGTVPTRRAEPYQQEGTHRTNKKGGSVPTCRAELYQQSIYTETTTEITTETTNQPPSAIDPSDRANGASRPVNGGGGLAPQKPVEKSTVKAGPWRRLCHRLIAVEPTWSAPGAYIDGLSDQQCEILAGWLKVAQLLDRANDPKRRYSDDPEGARIEAAYGKTFEGVRSRIRVIRSWVTAGEAAPLTEDDAASLAAEAGCGELRTEQR